MQYIKKNVSFISIIIASALLTACGKDDTDAKENAEEIDTTPSLELDYDNITQQIKVDSYLNKIEDYNFEGYFFPSGISSYDRAVMAKQLNKYFYNPYFYDMIYAISNGDLDEEILITEFNKLYTNMKEFRDLTGDLRDVSILEAFNNKNTSLEDFKKFNEILKEEVHRVYDAIKTMEFDTLEGKMLHEFHNFYLDYWLLEIDNQFETISRLTEDKQKTYNVTDFTLRLSNYGEEASYVDTFIILLEATNIKNAALIETTEEESDSKETDSEKKTESH